MRPEVIQAKVRRSVSRISGMVTGMNHLDYRKQKGSSAAVRKKQQYLLVSVVFSSLG